jgi:phospholipase/carboxylesterase
VEKLIEQEILSGILPAHIFLAGFSQGGAIALHTGLHFSEKLGGILALSTYLPLADTLNEAATSKALSSPLFMAHGLSDPVVPYALGKASAQELLRRGYTLDWYEYEMPHTVCSEEVKDIEHWLKNRL